MNPTHVVVVTIINMTNGVSSKFPPKYYTLAKVNVLAVFESSTADNPQYSSVEDALSVKSRTVASFFTSLIGTYSTFVLTNDSTPVNSNAQPR